MANNAIIQTPEVIQESNAKLARAAYLIGLILVIVAIALWWADRPSKTTRTGGGAGPSVTRPAPDVVPPGGGPGPMYRPAYSEWTNPDRKVPLHKERLNGYVQHLGMVTIVPDEVVYVYWVAARPRPTGDYGVPSMDFETPDGRILVLPHYADTSVSVSDVYTSNPRVTQPVDRPVRGFHFYNGTDVTQTICIGAGFNEGQIPGLIEYIRAAVREGECS